MLRVQEVTTMPTQRWFYYLDPPYRTCRMDGYSTRKNALRGARRALLWLSPARRATVKVEVYCVSINL